MPKTTQKYFKAVWKHGVIMGDVISNDIMDIVPLSHFSCEAALQLCILKHVWAKCMLHHRQDTRQT